MFPPVLKKAAIVQVRAGRMKYAQGIVTPDLKSGYLSMIKCSSESVELIWSGEDGTTENYPLRKDNTTVTIVSQCTTGRVLLFESKADSGAELHFFWLQEKSTAKDADILAKMQAALAAPASSAVRSGTTSSSSPIQPEDFRKIIASIANGNELSLSSVVASPLVSAHLREDPAFYHTRLREHLPPGSESEGDLADQLMNPQVSRAAAALTKALRNPLTCQEVCRMYGLPEGTSGVMGFLQAIMNSSKKTE